MHGDRHGAKQPDRFNPARAVVLDDTSRFDYVPPERLLDELAPPPGAKLLDFGAGTGLYAVALAQRRADLRILALDEQPQMLEHLRQAVERAGVSNVQVIDASALPSLRGRVDRILALNVLHEVGDSALADLRALLKPDGTALIIDWNAEVDRPVGPPRDHVYTPPEAMNRLESAGFAVDERQPLRYHLVLVARPTALA